MASALDQRLDAAVAKSWAVEPGGERRRDRRAAEALRDELQALDLDLVCRRLLYAVWYGYAVAEAVWQPSAAGVHLAALRVRAPDRFCWDARGDLALRTEAAPQGVPVPPHKFVLLARPGEHGDVPHGVGLARWCYWPVELKRLGVKFWATALEKFGTPTAKATYRRGADQAEVDRLLGLLRDLAGASGVAIPEDQSIELLEAVRRSEGSHLAYIEYWDRAITRRILGQSSTTDQGPWRGTAEVQKDVRDETVEADCRLLDAALNTSVVRWWAAWNWPGAAVPRLHRDAAPPEDLDARAVREEIVARTAGRRPTLAHVQSVYGGEWVETPAHAGTPAPAPGAPVTLAAHSLPLRPLSSRESPGVRAARATDATLEAATSAILDDWEPLLEPVVAPVREVVGQATSLAAVSAALEQGPGGEAAVDPVTQRLHRTGFAADLSGAADPPEASG